MAGASKRPRKKRESASGATVFRISVAETNGRSRWLTADLVDHSEEGLGIALATPLAVGLAVHARGRLQPGSRDEISVRARVVWCLERPDGTFRAGLHYLTGREDDPFKEWQDTSAAAEDPEIDHYEVLQLSACADPETIHRVYRLLAQRYHPDNCETGDEVVFRRVLSAYKVLKDPERRAAYDAQRLVLRKRRWRVFDQQHASLGVNAERRQRQGLLELLYTQRLSEPEHPYVTIHEMEDLLGVPRDHLQVTLWYLKEKGFVVRSDNGRYSITAAGFDEAEVNGAWQPDLVKRISAPQDAGGSTEAAYSSQN